MPFDDNDLKRLKWALENHAPNWVDKDNLRGLLARLEASERVNRDRTRDNWEAWEKSCGR